MGKGKGRRGRKWKAGAVGGYRDPDREARGKIRTGASSKNEVVLPEERLNKKEEKARGQREKKEKNNELKRARNGEGGGGRGEVEGGGGRGQVQGVGGSRGNVQGFPGVGVLLQKKLQGQGWDEQKRRKREERGGEKDGRGGGGGTGGRGGRGGGGGGDGD